MKTLKSKLIRGGSTLVTLWNVLGFT